MLSWDGISRKNMVEETRKRLKKDALNVWTIHAEFEGTTYFPQFHEMIEEVVQNGVDWIFLPDYARQLLANRETIHCDTIEQGTLPGRAGTVTCQHG